MKIRTHDLIAATALLAGSACRQVPAVEARYHRTRHRGKDVHYFPLTFGVTF